MQLFDLMNNSQHLLAYIALCIVRVFDQVDLPVFHGTYCCGPTTGCAARITGDLMSLYIVFVSISGLTMLLLCNSNFSRWIWINLRVGNFCWLMGKWFFQLSFREIPSWQYCFFLAGKNSFWHLKWNNVANFTVYSYTLYNCHYI